jgi:1-acyl-sn-glycerol-3-phosphate acyltransferase
MLFGQDVTRAIIKVWAKAMLFCLKIIAGVTFRIEGPENMPKDSGALVAVNHQSMWETVALYALLPKPVMILKKELMRIPIYGWWAGRAENIPIDRKGGARALKAMRNAARNAIANGAQVVVFPEGTRIKPGVIAPYHPGAAGIYTAAGAPCYPAAHDSGRFWRYPGVLKTPGEITLKFLPPIAPGLDRKEFLRELKERIDGARPDLAAPISEKVTAHG